MSVPLGDRHESRVEAIHFADKTIQYLLLDLLQRNFGIRDMDAFIREKFRHVQNKDGKGDFEQYWYLLYESKTTLQQTYNQLLFNLRSAYALNPINEHEWEVRRDHLNSAIFNCEMLIKHLQKTIERFEVDVNTYWLMSDAIDREIELIKKWRQRDNRIRAKQRRASR